MNTQRPAAFTLLAVLFLSLAACQKSSPPTPGVGVVDLDKVATAQGWLTEINKSLQGTDAELKGQLQTLLRNSLKLIEDTKKEVAAEAKLSEAQITALNAVKDNAELEKFPFTKEQRDKLVAAVNQANAAWQQGLNGYQQALQGRRTQLVLEYRERVRPVVRRVAAAKNISVVLGISDTVLWHDPVAADLTSAVIDELSKSGPAPAITATTPPSTPTASAAPAATPAGN